MTSVEDTNDPVDDEMPPTNGEEAMTVDPSASSNNNKEDQSHAVVSPENATSKVSTSEKEGTKKQRDETANDDGEIPVVPKTSNMPQRPIKRARTAYFIFTDEKRPQVQAEHPGKGVAEVARIMGQLWAGLTPEAKETYQKQAAEERERVAKELEEWKAAGGEISDAGMDGPSSTPRDSSALILPLARIRKICKLDPEVRGLSKEALYLITKCTELATAKLGKEAVKVAQLQNRRKLLPEDVAHVCTHRDQYMFLKDDIRDLVKSLPSHDTTTPHPKHHKKSDDMTAAAAAGSKPLTSYFGSSHKK